MSLYVKDFNWRLSMRFEMGTLHEISNPTNIKSLEMISQSSLKKKSNIESHSEYSRYSKRNELQ